ncbi:MAG TPA: 2-oxoacid:acceptor oxidoreductase family protein [Acidimicrobiales bacterium]|nr:2-oxoacid:acceptor oxidoreductase family protein [Acidimicrobiales bacterium]
MQAQEAQQVELILTGIGGQGVQLCAKCTAMAAVAEGRQAMLSADYGGEMRGGKTEASVVVSAGELRTVPILPATWSAFVMHGEFFESVRHRVRPGGVVVVNSTLVDADLGLPPDVRIHGVPATEVAAGLGAPMSAGFVLLGAFLSLTGLAQVSSVTDAMRELTPPYRTQHVTANAEALAAGGALLPPLAAPVPWQAGVAGGVR